MIPWKELAKLSFLQNEPQLKTPFIWLEVPTIEVGLLWDTTWKMPRARLRIKEAASENISEDYGIVRISRC